MSVDVVRQGPPLFGSAGAETAFLVARVVFGVVFAFFGLNHFLNAETMVGYVGANGVPVPDVVVPVTGGMVMFGGFGVLMGILPTLAAGAVAVFLVVTTPLMHGFWAASDAEQLTEMTQFLKNVAPFGAAVGFLQRRRRVVTRADRRPVANTITTPVLDRVMTESTRTRTTATGASVGDPTARRALGGWR